jgi:hypothetical protein
MTLVIFVEITLLCSMCWFGSSLKLLSYHTEGQELETPLVTATMCTTKSSAKCPVLNLAEVVAPPKGGVEGLPKYDISGITKLRYFLRFLVTVDKDEDVVFVDGSDVLFAGCGAENGTAGIIAYVQTELDMIRSKTGASVILGAEFNPYQVQGRPKAVPGWAKSECPWLNKDSFVSGHQYRYANTGLVAGRVSALLPVIKQSIRTLGKNRYLGDQGAIQKYFIEHTRQKDGINATIVVLDYCARLVLNMALPDNSFINDNRLNVHKHDTHSTVTLKTGIGNYDESTTKKTCFLHYAGWSKKYSQFFGEMKRKVQHTKRSKTKNKT